MNVIAKISYLERRVVTLKLRKNILYIELDSMSTHTGVTNCQKQSGLWPTV